MTLWGRRGRDGDRYEKRRKERTAGCEDIPPKKAEGPSSGVVEKGSQTTTICYLEPFTPHVCERGTCEYIYIYIHRTQLTRNQLPAKNPTRGGPHDRDPTIAIPQQLRPGKKKKLQASTSIARKSSFSKIT